MGFTARRATTNSAAAGCGGAWDTHIVRVVGGKIEIFERIASGGMADVFRGRNVVTGADVAVKLLPPSAEEIARERFRFEARVASKLVHRGIVRVFDLLEDADGTLALVMELLVGETVEQRLARGRIDAVEAVAIALPILGALEHAHSVGVVHRDIKPANILLAVEPDGRVTPKLVDFGIAKAAVSSVQTIDGTVLGTARYMSPEQIRGETLDGRSDVFSVAVTLYEAMTGTSPFAAADATTSIAKVLELSVDPDDLIPAKLWLSVERALAKQRYGRPDSAAVFARELLAALGASNDDLAAHLTATPPTPTRFESTRDVRPVAAQAARAAGGGWRPRLVMGGLVVAAACAVAVATFGRTDRAPAPAAPIASASVAPAPVAASPSVTSEPSVVAPAASPQGVVAVPAKGAPKPPLSHSPSRPPPKKDVATTPGF
jgi:serine/threonine protein kinase